MRSPLSSVAGLDEHRVPYEREWCPAGHHVDFLFASRTTVVEVDGAAWHGDGWRVAVNHMART